MLILVKAMSLFYKDLQNDERILVPYLNKVYEQAGLIIDRQVSLDEQHYGIDFYLLEQGRRIPVDEKAQVHYLNKSLPTFAFEIGYLKNGEHRKGWLFDEHKNTECYFLIVHIYVDGNQLTSAENIKSCRVLRINRPVFIGKLESLGFGYQTCSRWEKEARLAKSYGRIEIPHERRFSFNLSKKYDEQSFNLVVRLDFLTETGSWII